MNEIRHNRNHRTGHIEIIHIKILFCFIKCNEGKIDTKASFGFIDDVLLSFK